MFTNLEAEAATLGAILATYGKVEDCLPLEPEDFWHRPHALIWRAMLALQRKGLPVNLVTVFDKLKAMGDGAEAGGHTKLQELSETVPRIANPGDFARMVREASHRRKVRDTGARAAALAADPNIPPEKAALEVSAALAELGAASVGNLRTFSDAMDTLLDRLQAIRAGTYQHYIPTGIQIWDELLGGVARGIVTLVPAYPGVGKGAVAGRMLLNLGMCQRKSILFSLEDPEYWLPKRYMADYSGVPVRRLMQGERLPEHYEANITDSVRTSREWGDNVIIDDRCGLTPEQIAATARQAVVQRGAEVIVIDNASEVNISGGGDRHDVRAAESVRMLRDVAKSLNVAVVLLMHMKKSGNVTKEQCYIRPTTELLKNSGAYAEVARAIVALWREEGNGHEVVATILKQTEGEKDIDFTMAFNASAGLVSNEGGRKKDGQAGYTQPSERGAA